MKHDLFTKARFVVIISILALMLSAWKSLPSIPNVAKATDGNWSGTTSRGNPMSFTVSTSGGQWSTFYLKTDFDFGSCSGTIEQTVPGPGAISSDQFNWSGSTYAFTGQFTSPTTANGTYSFTNLFIFNCGYLTQSGTWTASMAPLPPGPFGKITPSNGAVGQSTSSFLSWGNSSNASTYEYCYDTTNNAVCDGTWISTGTATSATLNGLSGNTSYYWQARAINSAFTMYADSSVWWSFTTGAAPTFADVPFDHPLYKYIEALYDAGLTAGCSTSPLMFCPDTILDRAQSAVFMLRGQLGSGYTPPPAPWTNFVNESWVGFEWAQGWAEGMYIEGLTTGCQTSPLKFCPANQLPRVEASIFGLKMKYGMAYVPPTATGTLFADFPSTDPSYWGIDWAEKAYTDGLLPSCGTDPVSGKPMFCPGELVNRGWGAYLIVKAKGLPTP